MKKTLVAIVAAVALVAGIVALGTATTGCGTLNTGSLVTTNNIASTEVLVQTLTEDSVVLLLSQEGTNARPYVVAVGAAVNTVAGSTNASPAAFTAALKGLPIQGISTVNATIAINAITTVYTLYFNNYVTSSVNQNLVATALLTGIGNGINQALQASPAQLKLHRQITPEKQ